MVVSGQQAEVYIEDMDIPALFIPDLKRKPEAGNYYTSRDYRYLGTIGLFDEIYLDLHKGDNSILFAVTENFGGWGIIASMEDWQGLKLSD